MAQDIPQTKTTTHRSWGRYLNSSFIIPPFDACNFRAGFVNCDTALDVRYVVFRVAGEALAAMGPFYDYGCYDG
jgi:hypothetical protein